MNDSQMTSHQLENVHDVTAFLTAGNATFTLVSQRTGARLTYKVTLIDGETDRFFVGLLTGPDNEHSYSYAGMLAPKVFEAPVCGAHAVIRNVIGWEFRLTAKSRITKQSQAFRALEYVLDALNIGQMPRGVEVWHEGRCGRCGRKLTVPESIAAGIGPECAKLLVEA